MTTTSNLLRPFSNHSHTSKVDTESDMASGMRVSVLSRSFPLHQTSTGTSTGTTNNTSSFRDHDRENGGSSSSASSIRSDIRSSSDSYASAVSTRGGGEGGMSPARMIVKVTKAMKDRLDPKLTPSVLTSPLILEPKVLEEELMEEVEERG